MQLIIYNKPTGKEKVYNNQTVIPVVGSFINDFHQPLPQVTSVTYDYDQKQVCVICE
ncbi:MAG TPA: hypothetical protein VLA13_04060 [Massilibacterium sp.]|nr:hypothetical protein [Massilibacterium sp.]